MKNETFPLSMARTMFETNSDCHMCCMSSLKAITLCLHVDVWGNEEIHMKIYMTNQLLDTEIHASNCIRCLSSPLVFSCKDKSSEYKLIGINKL